MDVICACMSSWPKVQPHVDPFFESYTTVKVYDKQHLEVRRGGKGRGGPMVPQ